jgi:hypothetical protein
MFPQNIINFSRILAGLLTRTFFGTFPILLSGVVSDAQLSLSVLTAAGTVQDFHLIPF